MRLFDVFSDNALFQANSMLTLRGLSEAGTTVFARLRGHNATAQGKGVTNKDGIFEIIIDTPTASCKTYEIIVTDGNDTITLKNIVFGELWIASGQSNMELQNCKQFECAEFLDSVKHLDIRIFHQENGREDVFSPIPENETCGRWISTLNPFDTEMVSACASAFCKAVAEHFDAVGRNVPVGFLNLSWGGTPIYSWIPEYAISADALAKEHLTNKDLFPLENKSLDFQYPCVMFNRKIAPVRGIKAKGLLWYQGECDSFYEFNERIYKHLLYILRDSFADLFAKSKADFKIISSLIYPCNYTDTGDTNVGYLNDAFVKASVEQPETFICVPTYDLPPSWWPLDTNHPIHPLHKYALGKRMAQIAIRNVYKGEGQKLPSRIQTWKCVGNRIILTFDETEKGLYTIDSKHIRGMYIAGEENLYMPADCEILSNYEIAVYHPYLEKPCKCLYGWSSLEVNLNLFSGDFPILPFATDGDCDEIIKVELKSFLNLDIQSELEWFEDEHHTGEWYYRPVWRPLDGSNVCIDNAFTLQTEGRYISLSVDSLNERFGVYTVTQAGHAFDFQKYSSLEVDVFYCGLLSFDVILDYTDGRGVKLNAKYLCESSMFFKHYSIDFSEIPDGEINKMSFVFSVNNQKLIKRVNIGRIYLCPK